MSEIEVQTFPDAKIAPVCEICGAFDGQPAPTRDVFAGKAFVAVGFRLPGRSSDAVLNLCRKCQTDQLSRALECFWQLPQA